MIKEIVVYPVFGIIMLTLGLQLVDIAESTASKTGEFAYDMEKALGCAVNGQDLTICSPNIYNHSFDSEIEDTLDISAKLTNTLKELGIDESMIESYNETIIIHLKE